MPAADDGDGSNAKAAKPVRPPEEIIQLQFDANDNVKVEHPRNRKGNGKGERKGQGKGHGVMANRLVDDGNDDDDEPKKPKMERHKLGEGMRKFSRAGNDKVTLKGVQDIKLRGKIKKGQKQNREDAFRLTKSEVLQTTEVGYLEPENSKDRTFKVTQGILEDGSTVGVARKHFSLDLPYGPYVCNYTKNGRHVLVGGRKGHTALIQCDNMKLESELNLKETVRAVQPLHNHMMYAVAQKKYVYIYDQTGLELHCLKDQTYPTHLDFLPYHFLLVTAGERADLHYRDISTGQPVSNLRTRLGPTRCMRQNPRNGVMHLGHSNGTVTLWTPKVKEPVVKVLSHFGHVTGVAVHDNYMITTGADSFWKVWDLRKYETVNSFKTYGHCAADVDISMTGLVSIGFGSHLQVWRDTFNTACPRKPYMTQEYPGKMVNSVRFQPYEDVLCVGHGGGFGTLIVPGAGFANFDSFEANPFETGEQRREKEVRDLMDKLQPDSIMLDPNQIGNINVAVAKKYREEDEKQQAEEKAAKKKEKKKMRGKNKVGKRLKKKHLKEGAEQRQKARASNDAEQGDSSDDDDDDDHTGMAEEDEAPMPATQKSAEAAKKKAAGSALGRFYGKRQKKT